MLLVNALYLAHLFACFFYFITTFEEQGGGGANMLPGMADSWVVKQNLLDEDGFVKYVVSLYWAVSTMAGVGYGDIVPVTSTERMYTIAVQVGGAKWW